MIKIICVGKLKEKYLIDGVNDYLTRLRKYHKIDLIELPDTNIENEGTEILKHISNKDNLIKTIIYSLEKNSIGIDYIENNMELALFLNRNEDFINYILKVDLKNVKYIDWHNLTDKTITKVINDIIIM